MKAFYLLIFVLTSSIIGQTKNVNVDFAIKTGVPKNVLGVNVGPDSSIFGYKDIGISMIRTHDYYGPCDYWTYTKNALDTIKKTLNSSFNPIIETSYTWIPTDKKIDAIVEYGFIPFFRLGISYPNTNKVPIFPPIDPSLNSFNLFASICKQTVKHFNLGWANGRNYNINYWEIWNEPDFAEKFWTGPYATPLNYYKMYKAVAESIKTLNPKLKVGGPGLAYYSMMFSVKKYRENFIEYCKNNTVPLDFYSFHLYDVKNPYSIKAYADTIRNFLDLNGFNNSEIIISEINPGLGNSMYENTTKGGVWNVSALITCNKSKVDNFFWYRGTLLSPLVGNDIGNNPNVNWNGLGYKAYKLFYNSVNSLVQTDGDEIVQSSFRDDVTSFLTLAGISSKSDTVSLLISNLNSTYTSIKLNLSSIPWTGKTRIEEYSLKQPNHRLSLISKDTTITGGSFNYFINSANNPSAYLIKIYKYNLTLVEELTNKNIPLKFALYQNYPNPFNPETTLKFSIPEYSGNGIMTTLTVYDVMGKQVATLVNEPKSPGTYEVKFNATQLSSGVYFYKLECGYFVQIKKFVLMK